MNDITPCTNSPIFAGILAKNETKPLNIEGIVWVKKVVTDVNIFCPNCDAPVVISEPNPSIKLLPTKAKFDTPFLNPSTKELII